MMMVPVMLLLSVEPTIDTDLEPFFAKLCLPTGIYFKGVWSSLRMRKDSTLCSSAIVINVMKIHKLSFVFSSLRYFNFPGCLHSLYNAHLFK